MVITSVTRDDLPDGGASQFAKTIFECRISNIECRFEVLIPDFQGNASALQTVLDANPYVLNHNIETVPRLYSNVRPQASYERSINLIRRAKRRRPDIYLKSGFMVGLGEEKAEIFKVLEDLKEAGCDIVTIGQYLPPSREHLKPERYVLPEEFEEFQKFEGLKVVAGPFVRSSYRAGELV
jgi:lipoic acid synthetase